MSACGRRAHQRNNEIGGVWISRLRSPYFSVTPTTALAIRCRVPEGRLLRRLARQDRHLLLLPPQGRDPYAEAPRLHRLARVSRGGGGARIRGWLAQNSRLDRLVDFDGFLAFADAGIATSVTVFDTTTKHGGSKSRRAPTGLGRFAADGIVCCPRPAAIASGQVQRLWEHRRSARCASIRDGRPGLGRDPPVRTRNRSSVRLTPPHRAFHRAGRTGHSGSAQRLSGRRERLVSRGLRAALTDT